MSELETVRLYCKALRLPTMAEQAATATQLAERENWSLMQFLAHLMEQEVEGRRQRRIKRLQSQSQLPTGKTFAIFDEQRLPLKMRRQLAQLKDGSFVSRAHNILCFGLPGTGKTHLAAALGHLLVERGHSVLFIPAFKLVARLLRAKREVELDRELRRLDKFEVIILDDIGYIQHAQDEMEVLFTFLSERYERRSVIITSNLVFSDWGRIFKDPLTTAAAIDRVVHHSTILEFGREMRSLRMEHAVKHNQQSIITSSSEATA